MSQYSQALSCECYEVFKNSSFTEHLWTTALYTKKKWFWILFKVAWSLKVVLFWNTSCKMLASNYNLHAIARATLIIPTSAELKDVLETLLNI